MKHRGLFLNFLLPAFLAACGGEVMGVETTGPEPMATNPSILCDGTSATRLVIRHHGGGGLDEPRPGMAMDEQIGSSLLTIDGQCHYVAYADINDVRIGTIAMADVAQLERDLSVDKWRDSPRVWDGLGCDESEIDYRFDDVVISQSDGCRGNESTVSSFDTSAIIRRTQTWIERLVAQSAPDTQAVRAIVYIPEGEELSEAGGAPKAWPLATQPSTVALTSSAANRSFGMVISIADSAALRRLMVGAGEVGAPVIATDGKTYLLLTRDVVPGEAPDGTLDLGLK